MSIKDNNFWHHQTESETVFVFVHGFFSDSHTCWASSDHIFWPDLVRDDPRFFAPSIYLAGYYTDIDSKDYRVQDCAREIYDSIRRKDPLTGVSVLDKKNIVFICHSLGGIVVRCLLEAERLAFQRKNIGLVLIGSPSNGSDYADSFKRLIRFYKNRIADQLRRNNDYLIDLDDRFRAMLERKDIPNLVGAEAIEHHFVFHVRWIPGLKPVVDKASASRYFGAGKLLPGTDHWTCVKPNKLKHAAHEFLVDFYEHKFKCIEETDTDGLHPSGTRITISEDVSTDENAPLFDIYNEKVKNYYVGRDIDVRISETLAGFSIWLSGESGVGKTSALRREILSANMAPVNVYIGHSIKNGGHKDLLYAIYIDVCSVSDCEVKPLQTPHEIVNALAIHLSRHCSQSIVFLSIDEIPKNNISDEEIKNFIDEIVNLIISIKQRTGGKNARLIISSILDPTQYADVNQSRIGSHIKFLSCERWSKSEIKDLIKIASKALPGLALNDCERRNIVEVSRFHGLPRFVKTFFKNYKINSSLTESSVYKTLRQTELELNLASCKIIDECAVGESK